MSLNRRRHTAGRAAGALPLINSVSKLGEVRPRDGAMLVEPEGAECLGESTSRLVKEYTALDALHINPVIRLAQGDG